MAQLSRAPVASQRTWVQFPTLTQQLKSICNSNSRKSNTFFWPLQVPKMPITHITYMQTKHSYAQKKDFKQTFLLLKVIFSLNQLVFLLSPTLSSQFLKQGLPCGPDWPGTHFIDLEPTEVRLPLLPRMLALKEYITTSSPYFFSYL